MRAKKTRAKKSKPGSTPRAKVRHAHSSGAIEATLAVQSEAPQRQKIVAAEVSLRNAGAAGPATQDAQPHATSPKTKSSNAPPARPGTETSVGSATPGQAEPKVPREQTFPKNDQPSEKRKPAPIVVKAGAAAPGANAKASASRVIPQAPAAKVSGAQSAGEERTAASVPPKTGTIPPARSAPTVKPATPIKPPPLKIPVILGLNPLEVLRPDDLVSFYVDFVNLKLDTSNSKSPKLIISDTSNPAYLVVWFAPQALLEEAYFEVAAKITSNPGFESASIPPLQTTTDPIAAPGSVPAYMAGRSRLVFQLPPSVKEIPYSIEGLLDWSNLQLVVSPVALGTPAPPPIVEPAYLETAIELPWRIVLSPGKGAGWTHSSQPETYAGRTALWHTRLGQLKNIKSGTTTEQVLVEASQSAMIPLRAIWSDDFVDHGAIPPLGQEIPFRSSLDPHDRMQIVILTSGTLGYSIPSSLGPGGEWTPTPIQASRLFLSPLGGSLSSKGSWQLLPVYTDTQGQTQELDLIEWDHQATLGRDQYVRVVYTGFLYPFGHAASLIKVTERKVVPPDGATVTQATAYLRQHMYIVVREPEMTYGGEPYKYAGREMPFWQRVRIKTTVTPDIDIPVMLTGDGNPHNSFWVTVGGQYFQFHVEATDLAGSNISFLAPLVFMSDSEDYPTGVQSIYAGNDAVRVCTVKGQKIAYADPKTGDTILRTTQLFFTTEFQLTGPPYTIVPFIPTLDKASVTVPAVEQILGTASPVTVQLYSGYLQNGMDSNAGVYAEVTNPQPTISFNAGQSGGFSTPVLVMTALSARKGLVAGNADHAAQGTMDPSEFFDLTAQLFGTVPLQKLIPVDSSNLAPAAQNAPEIRTVLKPNSKAPTTSVTTVQWSPQLQNYENDPVKVEFNQNGLSSALNLKAQLTRNLAGGPPSSQITGQLTNFRLNLLGVIALTINSLKFTSNNGQKLIVVAKLPGSSPIQFIGPLSFIQTLANILPPGIFGGKGPSIDLEPSQIVVSYTLGLPPITVGVFSLEHIAITTGLALPYLDGQPGFNFAFASRGSPFLITVECLGGGGFVHLLVTASGVQMVEGALEFGGNFSIDLGVASGSVHAMAGIYFKLAGTNSDLTGFVDIGGQVSVLGIISISLDLNLSLSYQTSNGKSYVQGRATLTIGIHILFFSLSVSVSVERSFAANAGDPRISNVLTAADWQQRAAAFAT
ncbi:MAG TPA: hypothetical protein VKR52_17450 [Terracidiphilus sp.]|nr:hypothetical protein [Terracidiphilus sp.]